MRRVKVCGGQKLLLWRCVCEWYHLPPGYKHLDYVAIVTCRRGSSNRDEHEVDGHIKTRNVQTDTLKLTLTQIQELFQEYL